MRRPLGAAATHLIDTRSWVPVVQGLDRQRLPHRLTDFRQHLAAPVANAKPGDLLLLLEDLTEQRRERLGVPGLHLPGVPGQKGGLPAGVAQ